MGDYLTMNEKTKYDTIKAVVNERKTIERAQVELGLSRKQIRRLMDTYSNRGRKGFRHGNAKRPPSTTISPQIKNKIVRLYQNKYNGFNFTHYHEKLKAVEDIHVSYGSLRNIMDASEHIWFGDVRAHLHAAIEDATGKIVGAYFDWQETLNGYYEVTEQLITQYGIPYEIMTD